MKAVGKMIFLAFASISEYYGRGSYVIL